MGTDICLAGRQFAALPAAGAASPALRTGLRGSARCRRHSAANFYTVPGPDLARQVDGNIVELSVTGSFAKQRPTEQKIPGICAGVQTCQYDGILAKGDALLEP